MSSLHHRIAALALASIAATCQAELRTFNFTGTVNQSLPMAPAGARVTGQFSYDPDDATGHIGGDRTGPGYGYAKYSVPSKFTLRVNGHTVTAGQTNIDVANNFGGNIEDSLSITGGPMTLDGTYFSEGLIALSLASGPGKTHVLHSTRLPHKIQVPRFDAWAYGAVQVDGSSNGTVLSFTIDSVTSAPRGHDRSKDR